MQELNSGSVKSLLSYSGKILFINIWATWCPPCRAEMPGIQDLYNEFENSSDIQFIMLSVDDDPNIAQKFIDNKNFTFPVNKLISLLCTSSLIFPKFSFVDLFLLLLLLIII